MLQNKLMRVLSVAAVSSSLGCSGGASSREVEAARRKSTLFSVQAVACLSPATQKECDPGLAASFESPRPLEARGRRVGSIWCEGGRPHARLSARSGEVTGEFGQVVWEAIWRALKATDSCASTYGSVVTITRHGQVSTCKDPRFDLHELFDMAYGQATRGPPAVFREPHGPADDDSICAIDPEACRSPTPTLCPPFLGDPWNGVRAKRDEAADRGLDVGPSNADAPIETEEPGRRPTPGEVVKAIGAVLKTARKCSRADAPTAVARIVFQSDGTVQSVVVRGGEKSAEACIERALRRARVSTFSDPSYEVSTTLRASQ